MNTPKWLIAIVLVLALSMPATPVSAQSPATSVILSPPTPNPGVVGADISFTLVLDVANIVPGVAGVDIYLTYPPVVAPNLAPPGIVEPLPDFFGPSTVITVDNFAAGACPVSPGPCIHLAAAGPAQVTRSGAVARFHFVGLVPAPPAAPACFGLLPPIVMVDANGIPVVAPPALPAPPCVPIVLSTVTGIVLRQGRPIPPALPPGTPACSEVKLLSGGVVTFGPIFTGAGGGFILAPVPPLVGVQTLRAAYPGYLASQRTITIGGGGPIDVGTTTLRGGDVNGDNKINILDVGIIIADFGAPPPPVPVGSSAACPFPPPPPGSLDPVDINDDGAINISDLAIIAGANFGLVGPTPWQ